ncbi:MAG: homoserine kinase [Deltaproteobacteria bacterium]|nr:homoserine kinase [Deltaproteobacteria bacterium]
MKFTIRVPASTSNLGPGFDALGLALSLHNEVVVAPAEAFSVSVLGEGRGALPEDETNLIVRAARRACAESSLELPPVSIRCTNGIPLDRGLGSSSAAIVSGLLLGNHLTGSMLDREQLLALATELEGHPDNVAPALFGNLQVALRAQDKVHRVELNTAHLPQVVLFIPPFKMPTHEGRALLPTTISMHDAVLSVGRVALLVAALSAGRFEALTEATRDVLHQPPREKNFPAMPRLLDAARDAGAVGAWLSGAGSTLAAFARTVDDARRVARAFMDEGARCDITGSSHIVAIDRFGATVERNA